MVQVHPPAPDPPTATTADPLDRALARLLDREAPRRSERWLVAFSGGPDSLALAAALVPLAAARGVAVELGHVEHGIDADSLRRAESARALGTRLGLPFHLRSVDLPAARRRDESPEAAARRLRYAALEALRSELGAELLLTAHHRDDQVETLLLQIARGVAVERLGGVAAARGALRRPLLAVTRHEIEARLVRERLAPVRDPTNDDLSLPRNRLRHHTLPALRASEAGIDAALVALGARAAAHRAALGRRFAARMDALARPTSETVWLRDQKRKAFIEGKDSGGPSWQPASGRGDDAIAVVLTAIGTARERVNDAEEARGGDQPLSISFPLDFLTGLPAGLRPAALRWLLTERLGVGQLPSFPSMKAFLSLSGAGRSARLALPPRGARRLVARRGRLAVEAAESRTPAFSYTFSMPGEVELPELALRLRVRRSPVEPWMFRGEPLRAGFTAEAEQATVRNRRSGDRLRPLGAPGGRKLKAVLIDRGVPAAARDRLPMLEVAGELVWVPGITIGDAFALTGGAECWLAELEPLAEATAVTLEGGERTTTK